MSEAVEQTEVEPTSRELVFAEIRRLKLEAHVVELEEQGFTVVPDAIPMDMVEKMREVILAQTADKSGKALDLDTWDGGNLREGCYLLLKIRSSRDWSRTNIPSHLCSTSLAGAWSSPPFILTYEPKETRLCLCTPTSGPCI